MSCKHSSCRSATNEVVIGPEVVTYEMVHCNNCGKLLDSIVLNRRPK